MRIGILLLIMAIALGTNGAFAAITIENTLSPSYGTIYYYIDSDGTKSGNYAVTEQQGTDSTYVAVEGVNVYGASYFDGEIYVDTINTDSTVDGEQYGLDSAEIDVEFTGTSDVKVDNFNLYGYLTRNLAWAGMYVESVKAEDIDMEHDAWTHDEDFDDSPDSDSTGYQETDLDISVNDMGTPDYTMTDVYTTSMAGGSFDRNEFALGTENTWGGEGSFAMSNLEYGSFSIAGPNAADDYWDIYNYASTWDFDNNDLEVNGADEQYFEYGPLTFTVNSIGMSYADADMAYSNTDFGVTGFIGAEMDQEEAYAEWDYYYPDVDRYSEDDDSAEYIPLSDFDNVFSYGYANAPENIVEADIVFY